MTTCTVRDGRQPGTGQAGHQQQQAAEAASLAAAARRCPATLLRLPGMMRPATLSSSCLVRTSTGSTPGMRRSRVICSRKLPWSASTPMRRFTGSATILVADLMGNAGVRASGERVVAAWEPVELVAGNRLSNAPHLGTSQAAEKT